MGEATVVLASSGAIGTLGNITFVGGTIEFTSANTTDYSSRIKNSTAAVSLNTNGQDVTMAGTIDASNVAGLTKLGSGTLLLFGNNSYSGVTTISDGTIQLGSGTALGSTNGGTVAAAGRGPGPQWPERGRRSDFHRWLGSRRHRFADQFQQFGREPQRARSL